MFVAFDRDAFREVGGFDEGFFMYLEDADICRRLGEHGWATVYQSAWSVIHDAQRKSHRNLAHLRWYLSSALLFLLANPGRLRLMPCLGKPEAWPAH
jgi:N-acetylglucosaminyl-diphospho-decaprenol L-rhamnosyltransferase